MFSSLGCSKCESEAHKSSQNAFGVRVRPIFDPYSAPDQDPAPDPDPDPL